MREIWKDIKGYRGFYQISNLGNVKSLERFITYSDFRGKVKRKERILKLRENPDGYYTVILCKNKNRWQVAVHRLVAIHFLEKVKGKNEINHKNENSKDNWPGNLEWCDHIYNMNYGTARKRAGLKNRKPVLQIDSKTRKVIKWWSGACCVKEIGLQPGNVIHCCRGDYKTYKGYIWKYKEANNGK